MGTIHRRAIYIFGEAAHCFRDLGQAAQVERFASESAAAAHQQGRARRGALSHAALAIAALNRMDVEAAATIGTQVVDLTAAVNSSRCIEAVRDLQRRLHSHLDLPEVEQFDAHPLELLGLAA